MTVHALRLFARAAAFSTALALPSPTVASADVVTDWNAMTLTVANAGGRPAPSVMLDITMAQIAVHDAVQAYQHRFETYNAPIKNASGSPIAAVATAARDVLVDRFPAQATGIEATYQNYLAAQGLFDTDPGVFVGQQAARNILIRRMNDGSFPANPEVFVGGTAIGQWRPTPTAFAPMSAPWFGEVDFFGPRKRHAWPMPAPPRLDSARYARDYAEVKAIGARTGSTRTPEQTDLGYFFTDNFFSQMNRTVRTIAETHLTDIGDTARLLALANIAGTDALIRAWRAKRTHAFWRPSTAIAEGDNDGNPETTGDTAWLPLVNDPNYPDYFSGANAIVAAFMRTLARYFDTDAFTFTMTSAAPPVVQRTRTYTRFSDAAADCVDARVYLGIHFRFADTIARREGTRIADQTVSHLLRRSNLKPRNLRTFEP